LIVKQDWQLRKRKK